MAVTAYSVFYDYQLLRNVAIMNIVPLTQTSQEAEHWQALEMHNLLLDQETFVTQAGILLPSKADKPKAYNL
jgi:hypothetical protein